VEHGVAEAKGEGGAAVVGRQNRKKKKGRSRIEEEKAK